MNRAFEENTTDAEWDGVSQAQPCPICGATSGCRTLTEDAFASCARRPSEWPLNNGAWLHRIVEADGFLEPAT